MYPDHRVAQLALKMTKCLIRKLIMCYKSYLQNENYNQVIKNAHDVKHSIVIGSFFLEE